MREGTPTKITKARQLLCIQVLSKETYRACIRLRNSQQFVGETVDNISASVPRSLLEKGRKRMFLRT